MPDLIRHGGTEWHLRATIESGADAPHSKWRGTGPRPTPGIEGGETGGSLEFGGKRDRLGLRGRVGLAADGVAGNLPYGCDFSTKWSIWVARKRATSGSSNGHT